MEQLKAITDYIDGLAADDHELRFDVLQNHIRSLRERILLEDGVDRAPAVCQDQLIFSSVFAFLLEPSKAVKFLQDIRRAAGIEEHADPVQFLAKIESGGLNEFGAQSNGLDAEDVSVGLAVDVLQAAFRMSMIVKETLSHAGQSRELHRAGNGQTSKVDQTGLNKILVSLVHFGKLLYSPDNPNQSTKHEQQLRMMFAGFSIIVQMLSDLDEIDKVQKMVTTSVEIFELTYDVQGLPIDLRVDIGAKYLPGSIRALASDESCPLLVVPFRMYWFAMCAHMENKVNAETPWRAKQHLDSANHYCADTARLLDGGRYAFACWMLYGLCLYDCKLYDKAKVVLEMERVNLKNPIPQCCSRDHCLERCTQKLAANVAADGPVAADENYLLYFSDAAAGERQKEITAWDSIFMDPSVRQYGPRGEIPDYKRIADAYVRLGESNRSLPQTKLDAEVVRSLVLACASPFVDLEYRLPSPPKDSRTDNVLQVFGGSVNEKLDLQSHLDDDENLEVPDIDVMMAVTPSNLGLQAVVDASDSRPGYCLLKGPDGNCFPSFEMLVDALPIALNKVASFVADRKFVEDYEIESIVIHGPAISTKLHTLSDVTRCYDHVPAFWIKSWPDAALDWIHRPRRHGWPSSSTIDDIVAEGILLVAACHRQSKRPLDEWRVSFTLAERILIDTLSSIQRLAYLYAKLILKAFLRTESSFLVSYHLKTALLWLCEKRPAEFWTEGNLTTCVAGIFAWLRSELAERRIRNYFIPANNMLTDVEISLVGSSNIDTAIEQLDDIIANTFERIVEADCKLVHIPATRNVLIGDVATPALAAENTRDALAAMFQRLLLFCSNHTMTDKQQEQFKRSDEICRKLREALQLPQE